MLDICVYLWGNKGAPQKRQKGDKKNAPVSVDRALHSGKLERLEQFFEQFSHCFHSKTRKSDKIALQYLKGLLLADKKNCTEMALVLDDKTNNQSLNHFLSDSVWDYKALEDSVGSFFYDLLDDEGMSNDCCLLIDECAIVHA